MHDFVLQWGQQVIETYKLAEVSKVLEIGSQNVNGSLREFFKPTEKYIGVDIEEGPGVDLVYNGNELCPLFEYQDDHGFKYEKFDVVVCTEMLEHCESFWSILQEISFLLKPSGYLILTARGATSDGRAMFEHSYPHDYWRFMPQSWRPLARLAGCEIVEAVEDTQHPGFCLIARKR